MYRVGYPGWKLAARLNVPLLIKLDVIHDKDAGVFVITSADLRGLVVEAPDTAIAEELHGEIQGCVESLMRERLTQPPKVRPITAWPGEFQLA